MHPSKCFILFQAVAFLTQPTPVSGVGNEDIGPKPVTSSTGKDRVCIPSSQPRVPTLGSLLDTDLKPEIVVNDYFGEELERVEQVEHLDYEYIFEFLDRHEPVNAVGLPNVKGRLKSHLAFWIDIKAPDFIIDCIREGYKIPFYSTPEPATFPNNRSAHVHADFVSEALLELLSTCRIVETRKEDLVVINPLSVATNKSDKKRLILDLRYVNKHIYKQKIKFEDWRTAINYFGPGKYFTKFDLKSGYHHLDIFSEHQSYLGFSWPNPDGSNRCYRFTVLPFGLSSAPYIFTKLLRPLIRHWRGLGISTTIFLDDNIDMENSPEISHEYAKIIKSDLCMSGLVANDDKSIWVPTQSITWLGLDWNGVNGTIAIASHRLEKLNSAITTILNHHRITARQLARVVGQIISTGPVTGNLARILSRHCQMSVACAANWDTTFLIDDYCLQELQFWITNLKLVNARSFKESSSSNRTICSDASATACGAIILGTNHVAHRMFTQSEQETSSTYRELLAIQLAIQAFEPLLTGCKVKLFTDSQVAMKIAQIGSMKLEYHELAISIFSTCFRANIQLDLQWIPRTLNEQADYVSKLNDFDDWEVVPGIFEQIDAQFGPHTLDCFANSKNAKVSRYFSRFWNPGTTGVDAFYQDWSNEIAWVVPPISIVPRVLWFMFENKCKGTLVTPYWQSAAYWPLLVKQFVAFVRTTIIIKGNVALRQGSNSKSLLGSPDWQGNVLVCSLDFSD